MADGKVIIVPFEPNHRPNADADVASIVRRVVAIEDRIDAENKLKALVFSEARVSGLDIGALKSVIRVCRYLPQSSAGNLNGMSEVVKLYLDQVNTAHKKTGEA